MIKNLLHSKEKELKKVVSRTTLEKNGYYEAVKTVANQNIWGFSK